MQYIPASSSSCLWLRRRNTHPRPVVNRCCGGVDGGGVVSVEEFSIAEVVMSVEGISTGVFISGGVVGASEVGVHAFSGVSVLEVPALSLFFGRRPVKKINK